MAIATLLKSAINVLFLGCDTWVCKVSYKWVLICVCGRRSNGVDWRKQAGKIRAHWVLRKNPKKVCIPYVHSYYCTFVYNTRNSSATWTNSILNWSFSGRGILSSDNFVKTLTTQEPSASYNDATKPTTELSKLKLLPIFATVIFLYILIHTGVEYPQ